MLGTCEETGIGIYVPQLALLESQDFLGLTKICRLSQEPLTNTGI